MSPSPESPSPAPASPSPSPSPAQPTIIALSTTDIQHHLPSLQALLLRCVNDDPPSSSIGFLAPLSPQAAAQHWLQTTPSRTTRLLAAVTPAPAPQVIATVLVAQMAKETHSFRGEVRKLLVHPDHRRGGLGRRMMQAAERLAREDMALEVLTLDTATRTGAREFYRRNGWTELGVCPDYARAADGRKGECSFFVKMLGTGDETGLDRGVEGATVGEMK